MSSENDDTLVQTDGGEEEVSSSLNDEDVTSPEISSLEKKLLESQWNHHQEEEEEEEEGGHVNNTEDTDQDQISSWKKKFGNTTDDNDNKSTGQEEVQKEEQGEQYTWKRADGRKAAQEEDDEKDEEDEEEEEDAGTNAANGATGGSRPIASGIDDLPLFADEKNKQLHSKIRSKEKLFQDIKTEVVEHFTRVEIMQEHLKNVKQELVHTQELYTAKQKEFTSEEHMKQLTEREIGRVQQELRKYDMESKEMEAKLNQIQNFLFKGNETMDQFKLQMNWNQDEMEQWAMASKQKEEDAFALEKYRRADDVKIKELTLEIEKLTKILQQNKRHVEEEATETQAKQIELEKASEEFKVLHMERQKLVKQWQETIEQMQKRDQDIQKQSEQFVFVKKGFEQKKNVLQEHQQRLKSAEQENVDIQNKINTKERQQFKIQQEFQQTVSRVQEFRDQVDILKNQLSSSVLHLNQQRSFNTNKSVHLENVQLELEHARQKYKMTKQQFDKMLTTTVNVETIAKEAEEDLNQMEIELKRIEKEITIQKEQMFKKTQFLFSLRQKEATLIAEIAGLKASCSNLSTKMKQLEQQALRQQELVYNGEFQIQQMERKVSRASGERSIEETKLLQQQIQLVQMENERVVAEHNMLLQQLKKVQEEQKQMNTKKKKLCFLKEELITKLNEWTLHNETSMNLLKQTLKEKEELLVQHDLQSLEVKRLKDILNTRADEVFSLENRDFQLKKSMEEKKKEIFVFKEIQKAQSKASEEERHQVSIELAEREAKVKKLQAKFDTLCKMRSGIDELEQENGQEEKSQAFFVIQAAQKRDELQREGDELDDKIRIAEKEVKALKKTLDHLDDRNSNYRKSFHRAENDSENGMKLQQLEEQVKQKEDLLFKRKKEFTRIEQEMENESLRLQEIVHQKQFLMENCKQLTTTFDQLTKETNAEKQKFEKIVITQKNKHKKMSSTIQLTLEMYELKEISASLLYTLSQLSNEFPEMSDLLQQQIQQNGLHIPALPPGKNTIPRKTQSSSYHHQDLPSRPGSARSERSVKSTTSMNSSRSSGSNHGGARIAAPVNKVRIGF